MVSLWMRLLARFGQQRQQAPGQMLGQVLKAAGRFAQPKGDPEIGRCLPAIGDQMTQHSCSRRRDAGISLHSNG